jgi:hypothetical protein
MMQKRDRNDEEATQLLAHAGVMRNSLDQGTANGVVRGFRI